MLVTRLTQDIAALETALHCQLFRTSIFQDGWEAYFRAQAERPDIILIDAGLAGMSSLMVARLLKLTRKTAGIPLVFLAHARQDWRRIDAFEVGAVDCIGGPWHEQEILARLRVHLSRQARTVAVPAGLSPPLHCEDVLWRSALRALEKEPEQFRTVKDLAGNIGTTERRLSALCKAHLGVTMHRHLVQQKMRMAGNLLRDTQMPVADIARYMGFQSACNFSVAFRQHAGASPSAFRAMSGAPPDQARQAA